PPAVAAAPAWSAPRSSQTRLDNGLTLHVLERRQLPLLELRLVLASGSASDAEHPGVAALTTQALELMASLATGRALAARVEALGGHLQLQTSRDACVFALTLPSSALAEGLSVLAALTAPRELSPAAIEAARVRELARQRPLHTSADWLAEQALYGELFRSSPRRHPYAHADTLPGELQRLTVDDSQAWYAQNFSPKNAILLVVGDASLVQVLPLAQRNLGSWQGREVAPPVFFPPTPPARLKTLLIHREGATRSELRIATLGPERSAPEWPAFAATQQVLGGTESSRARRELTRRGELAVELSAALVPLAYGATPLVISANVSTEHTALTLAALLDSLAALTTRQPSRRELRAAQQQLAASIPLRLETNLGAAEQLERDSLAGLPSTVLDEFGHALAQLSVEDVQASARRYLSRPPVIIVVGNARQLVAPLSHFGQVHLLDTSFQTERVVSQDPTAPLEWVGSVSSPGAGAAPRL
ncbi:MAG: hypothetical protein RL033_6233, partial [Pseudomonadota bacterium]